jgi:hypothetical protein
MTSCYFFPSFFCSNAICFVNSGSHSFPPAFSMSSSASRSVEPLTRQLR